MFAPRSDHFATQTAVFHETPVDTIITALEVQEQDPFHVDLVYQLTVTKSNSDDATRLLEWLSFPTRKVASYTAQGAPVTLESTIPLRSLILRHHGLDRQGYEALTRFVRGHSSLTSLTVGVSVTSVSRFGSEFAKCTSFTDTLFRFVCQSGTRDFSHVTTIRCLTL